MGRLVQRKQACEITVIWPIELPNKGYRNLLFSSPICRHYPEQGLTYVRHRPEAPAECCCLLCPMCVLSDFLLTTCSSSIPPHGDPFVPTFFLPLKPLNLHLKSHRPVSYPVSHNSSLLLSNPRLLESILYSTRPDCSLVLASHRDNPNRNSAVLDTFTAFP